MDKIITRGIDASRGRPKTFNEKDNSVQVVAVTENPVQIWDWKRNELVSEVLVINGAKLPASGKIPLLDSHNRKSVDHILGSARGFKANGDQLLCDVIFSSTPSGRNAALNVKEGHLTDFSVGYSPLEFHFLKAGETEEVNGKNIQGPVKITTQWALKELSITPIGADQMATARSETLQSLEESLNVSESETPAVAERDFGGYDGETDDSAETEIGEKAPEEERSYQEGAAVSPRRKQSAIDIIFYVFIVIMVLSLMKGMF
jgi:hypothetical protein